MNEPDIGIKVAERPKTEAEVLKAIEKTGRGFCPEGHGLVIYQNKDKPQRGWFVQYKERGKLKWEVRSKPPVKCPLCERE